MSRPAGVLRAMRALAPPEQRTAPWFRVENSAVAGGTATVSIYDEIGFWGISAADFAAAISDVNASTIELHLNSPGGEIFDGIAIKNALEQHPAQVNVTIDGLAASIASVIAMAGDTIAMAPGSQMMIHEGSGVCMGDASDMQQMSDLLNFQSANIANIYANRAGGTADAWRSAMQAETWYTAEEAVDAGLADKVLPSRKAAEQAADPVAPADALPINTWDLSAFRYAGRAAAPTPTATATASDAASTLVAKAIAIHHTTTTNAAWDGPAAVAAMPSEYADLHYCHAWQSAAADASSHTPGDDDVDDKKSSFKFPHHAKKGGPAHLDDADKAASDNRLDPAPVAAAAVEPEPEAPESAAPEAPDVWAALTSQFLTPRTPPTSDDMLRALREAHT